VSVFCEAALIEATVVLADIISDPVQTPSSQLSWSALQIGQGAFEILLSPGLADRILDSAVDVALRTHWLGLCPGLVCCSIICDGGIMLPKALKAPLTEPLLPRALRRARNRPCLLACAQCTTNSTPSARTIATSTSSLPPSILYQCSVARPAISGWSLSRARAG
jgi:hypothetical protein